MIKIKKILTFLFCILALTVSATSCTDVQNNEEMSVPTASEATVQTALPTEVPFSDNIVTNKIAASASINSDLNEIAKYSYDIDNDGDNEEIVLSSDCEKGIGITNDGHNWQLYIKDNDIYYLLIDQYIQLGDVQFEVIDYYVDNTPIPAIVATTSTNSLLKLSKYIFDSESNSYIEFELYNSSNDSENGINKMYSSNSEVRF